MNKNKTNNEEEERKESKENVIPRLHRSRKVELKMNSFRLFIFRCSYTL